MLFTLSSNALEHKKPNIIFLLADDLRWDSIAHLSKLGLKTPNLDELAKKSVRLTKSYNTTAICMASRAIYVSGLNEFSTGTNFTHGDMSHDTWQQSYPALLKKNGYFTGFLGKFGFHVLDEHGKKGKVAVIRNDFDYWGAWLGQGSYQIAKNPTAEAWIENFNNKKEHTTHALGLMGEDFIKKAKASGKPFNLSVSFKAPHTPYIIDKRYKDIYKEQKFAKPENFGLDDNAPKQALSGRPEQIGSKWLKNYNEAMYNYHSLVYGVDQAVGRILNALEENGVSDNTVVIFAGDNGHFNGSKGLGGKLYAYQEGTLSPTMIYDPRRKSTSEFETSDVLSGSIDIAPTILSLAQVPLPEKIQGKSLLPVLATEKSKQTGDMLHDSLLLMHVWGEASAQSLAVVTPTHKYIHWFYGGKGFERSEELFDLSKDTFEQENLVNNIEAAPSLKAMQAKYDRWLTTWAENGVQDKGYPKYLKIADRHTPFSDVSAAEIKAMYPGKKPVSNKYKDKNKHL
jgi:arylsulfatase A-like enzyme